MITRDLLPLAKPVSMFTPDPANARKHDEKSYTVIMNSLRQFGQQTERFFNRVIVSNTGCWEFTELQAHTGYGKFHSMGKTWRAHRWIMVHLNRINPESKLLVLHDCDNRSCVNPNHLSVGDQKKNMADAKARGRTMLIADARMGVKNPMSKLNEVKVLEIKSLLKTGMEQNQIARQFGVCKAVISEIKTGKLWPHIT